MKKYGAKYWKEEVQDKFCEYVESNDSKEKNDIYKKYLHEPLLEIVRSEIKRHEKRIKFYSSDLKDNLEEDTLSIVVEQIGKYNIEMAAKHTNNGGYGYCRIIARSHMFGRGLKEYKKRQKYESYYEIEENE